MDDRAAYFHTLIPTPGAQSRRRRQACQLVNAATPSRAPRYGRAGIPADDLRQDPRRGPPQRPRRAQRAGAPGRRVALPVEARRRRRADQGGGQSGAEGRQAAAPADHPTGAARCPAGAGQRGHCGAPRRHPGRYARTCPSASRRTGPGDGSGSPAAVAPHDGAVQARHRPSRLKPDISSSLPQSVTACTAVTARDPPICVATRLAALARRGAQIGMIWRCPDGRLMRGRRSLNG
jgi:hypothetical protein